MNPTPLGGPQSSEALRRTAALLRSHSEGVARTVAELAAYDRPDVWQGRRARDFHLGLQGERRRMAGPAGAATILALVAHALERRAAGIDAPTLVQGGAPSTWVLPPVHGVVAPASP